MGGGIKLLNHESTRQLISALLDGGWVQRKISAYAHRIRCIYTATVEVSHRSPQFPCNSICCMVSVFEIQTD